MKIFFCNILILLSVFSSLVQANDQQLSAHEYAARTHENIIEIIQTQNQLFEENPCFVS